MSEPLLQGQVWVSPRHLAGSTADGDAGMKPLLDLGWPMQHDELGNLYLTSPERSTVRLGYMPEGDDDALWRIAAYDDPFAAPRWAVAFNNMAPTEYVTAFTTALATAYQRGPDAYLTGTTQPSHRALEPLRDGGWQHTAQARLARVELSAPDGMAHLAYDRRPLDHQQELTTLETRWYLWGGPAPAAGWYITLSSHTPLHLVTAVTAAVADPSPVLRWDGELLRITRKHATITPVTPPAPTPLDIHRRSTSPGASGSIPRWSTSSRPAPPPASGPPSRRR
ncbi:DUF317 domain-containing protein [Streptomyces sp. YIM 98790]|uniref:DUF317 domain-containing protein n=1 Tax=Streptomyces sp. YIM 98790 TaxID=2689077 RepID=UPI00140B4B55|nr:DUF317 domain-containing protein [Streptomyces sp. YIM 98790]